MQWRRWGSSARRWRLPVHALGSVSRPSIAGDARRAAEWYANEYGVSRDVAHAWMTTQDKAEGVNEEVAASTAGPAYGGVWVDNNARRFKVGLTTGGDVNAVNAILASHGISASSDVVTVSHTQRQLAEAQPAIEDALADLPPGTIEIARNTETNSVQITVAAGATEQQRARVSATAASAPVRVTIVNSARQSLLFEELTCRGPNCSLPLRGGVRIGILTTDEDGNQHVCTAGFIARSRTDQAPYVLTSGHCFDNFANDSSLWGAFSHSVRQT
jgi:hypothetical protein